MRYSAPWFPKPNLVHMGLSLSSEAPGPPPFSFNLPLHQLEAPSERVNVSVRISLARNYPDHVHKKSDTKNDNQDGR